jgi:signal transduction histidine kinase
MEQERLVLPPDTNINALRSLLISGAAGPFEAAPMSLAISRRITQRTIVRVLILGFSLVILLLVAAVAMAIQNTTAIKRQSEALVREQALVARLINEISVEQGAVNAIVNQITRDPESIDPDEIQVQLDSTDEALSRIMRSAVGTPEAALWRDLQQAARAFSVEAKRIINADEIKNDSLRTLVRMQNDVRGHVRDLVLASTERSASAEGVIARESENLMRQSAILLGLCVLLAFVCAVFTVRLTIELFRRMEWQAHELSRVSWHMLQTQEATARRFSHELHDELGQSLTALKANVSALNPENLAGRRRDCISLVDEAIGNVRELSQLLRPVILDDFGLDSALRWLAEKFSQRTGIQVHYDSNFSGRLADETETHLFRIAQEALTNVARHSGATEVKMILARQDDKIGLTISDNGRGMPVKPEKKASLGVVGMRARARHAGGELTIDSGKDRGTAVQASVPARQQTDASEPENAHFIGR